MVSVDAHLHVVSPDVVTHPRREPPVGRDWWTGRPVSAPEVTAHLLAANVGRGVIVQAVGAYGYDDTYARSVVAAAPDRLALVPALDVGAPDPATTLSARLTDADDARVAAIRLFGVTGPTTWLTDGRARDVWSVCAEHGVPIVATLFGDDLEALAGVIVESPDVLVALDHAGFPDSAAPPPYPCDRLADLPAVHLKVTTHVLAPAQAPSALVARWAESFGASRLCWGSDHPQSLEHDYPEMIAMAEASAGWLRAGERDDYLGGTALRLFWPAGTAPLEAPGEPAP